MVTGVQTCALPISAALTTTGFGAVAPLPRRAAVEAMLAAQGAA
jgi:hypothetical protein